MKGRQIKYSETELEWIFHHRFEVRRLAHSNFVNLFKRGDVSLVNYNALCKRKGWLTGRSGRYEKGQVPINKGKKMPFNPNSARTQFKKGNKPHTFRGAGHETVCPKDGYAYLIVNEAHPQTGAPTRRVLKHKWLWERENGPLPEGHCLKCLDGDRLNSDPNNWLSIPRALLPRLNGHWASLSFDDAEPEIKPYLLAAARLQHAANLSRKKIIAE